MKPSSSIGDSRRLLENIDQAGSLTEKYTFFRVSNGPLLKKRMILITSSFCEKKKKEISSESELIPSKTCV